MVQPKVSAVPTLLEPAGEHPDTLRRSMALTAVTLSTSCVLCHVYPPCATRPLPPGDLGPCLDPPIPTGHVSCRLGQRSYRCLGGSPRGPRAPRWVENGRWGRLVLSPRSGQDASPAAAAPAGATTLFSEHLGGTRAVLSSGHAIPQKSPPGPP